MEGRGASRETSRETESIGQRDNERGREGLEGYRRERGQREVERASARASEIMREIHKHKLCDRDLGM